MTHNTNGKYGIRVTAYNPREFEHFDSLPRWARDIINSSSYKIDSGSFIERNLSQYSPKTIQNLIECATKMNVLAAYGPDHPQAQ